MAMSQMYSPPTRIRSRGPPRIGVGLFVDITVHDVKHAGGLAQGR
jgi:hypothetical protein